MEETVSRPVYVVVVGYADQFGASTALDRIVVPEGGLDEALKLMRAEAANVMGRYVDAVPDAAEPPTTYEVAVFYAEGSEGDEGWSLRIGRRVANVSMSPREAANVRLGSFDALDAYQRQCARTYPEHGTGREAMDNALLGLAGEAGEVLDLFKKFWYQGHEPDDVKVVEELGDVLYYVAMAAAALGAPLSDVANANVVKLRERYPEGFSAERSVNRDERAEREAMEGIPELDEILADMRGEEGGEGK